jgi:GT2 family glycosyltransferase
MKKKGAFNAFKKFKTLVVEGSIGVGVLAVDNEKRYQRWWRSQELTSARKKKIRERAEKLKYKPIISVLVPVYNPPPRWLEECFRSVEKQLYPYWELCAVNDASTSAATRKVLKRWEEKSRKDKRIKIFHQKKNRHISLTTNKCLEMASGEFIALLDHDDILHPAALYLMAKELNKNKDLDFIYSDEDKLDTKGRHCEPYFKSDWNPDLLLSTNYICHLVVIRKSLMEKLGGMRKGFEGSQDYDLFLRISEKTQKIVHIPYILYHWRKIEGSTSSSYQSKGYADKASLAALAGAGKRKGGNWTVTKGLATCSFRVKREIRDKRKISIIIPFRDKVELLKKCAESVLEKTDYSNYELVLVNNGSKEPKTFEYLDKIKKNREENVRVIHYNHPFNFPAINNWAVKQTDAPWIFFLNNDISVINRGWLTAMVEHIQREEAGAVGAKLLYPNGKIQHAGVVLGAGKFKDKPCGVAGHSHKYFPQGSHGYFEQIDVIRDYSAVTAACMLTKRDLFLKLGGFDAENFAVAWNDVDYCLRLRKKGYLIVYTPYARLYHYESVSRGSDEKGEKLERFYRETEKMYERWGDVLARDPYYNPNLSLEDESWRIKEKAKKIE